MAIRRLGGGTPANTSAAPDPAPTPTAAQHRPISAVPAAPPTSTGPRALAGAAGLPPPPSDVDTSGYTGPKETRDDAYWEAHPFRAGTHNLDAVVQKIVEWASGGIDVTFRILQWDNAENKPGDNHGRPFKWRQSREDLLRRWNNGGEDGEKARRGYAYWRRDLVAAYTSCGWPEESWPKSGDNPIPPWWLFFTHTCPDGVVVPVTLSLKIVVQPKRQQWPDLAELKVIRTSDGRPFQAPLPYCVPEAVAAEHRWTIAETKWFGDKAQVALPDRASFPFPHAGLPTYKDL